MAAEMMTGILREDIEFIRPGVHGDFPMLFDRQADVYYRIDMQMLKVVSYLSESIPLTDFIEKLKHSGVQIDKNDLLQILSFLHQNNLMVPGYGQMSVKLQKYEEMQEKTTFLRFSAAYLFFKLPPWRPEQFFDLIRPLVSWMASKMVVFLFLIPSVLGYLLMIRDFSIVEATFIDSLSWAGLVKYFIAILFLKIIHEIAHSLAAIHFNCRVRGIGLGFMVFYPRLYTDTTDSWRLPRNQRLLIDSAGIIIEILLGGIAALLWVYLPPGNWKSTLFYIFAVSTLSTLFVNGNPCIRYDGYYILCDLLNIENLMTRSSEHIKQWWRWHFLRLGSPPEHEKGLFLLFFGVISFVYRIFLYSSIILIIYLQFVKAVGVVLVFLELYSIMIYPFYKEIQTIRLLSKQSANKARWLLTLLFLTICYLLLFTPLSWDISLPGEFISSDHQLVTVLENGYLKKDLSKTAIDVKKGDLLFAQYSPELKTEIKRLEEMMRYNRILYGLQQIDDQMFPEAAITQEKIESDQLGLLELKRRQLDLSVFSKIDGIFIPAIQKLSTNAYLPRGLVIGKVVTPKLTLVAYAPDNEISQLQVGQSATVQFSDTLEEYEVQISKIYDVSARLKNSPLLQHFGGPIPVYFDEGNPNDYESVMSLYRIDFEWENTDPLFCGRTVKVKIHHSEKLYDRIKTFIIRMYRREF